MSVQVFSKYSILSWAVSPKSFLQSSLGCRRYNCRPCVRFCMPKIKPQFRHYSLFEPDYLDAMKPKIPLYNPLNVQLKGYNFVLLENYQKLVNNIAEIMGVEVEDGWATPPQHIQIQKYKANSTVIDAEYKLYIYERNLQLINLPSTVAPILFEALQTALPEGVQLKIHYHEDSHSEIRYIPDRELLDLKSQLDILGGPVNKKK